MSSHKLYYTLWIGEGGGSGYTGIFEAVGEVKVGAVVILGYSRQLEN